MTNKEKIHIILDKLEELKLLDPDMILFGAGLLGYKQNDVVTMEFNPETKSKIKYDPKTQHWGHRYSFQKKLTEEDCQKIESLINISLPQEYRDFLKFIGDGGAGPDYGLYSMGQALGYEKKYIGTDHFKDPFPLIDKWDPEEEEEAEDPSDELWELNTRGTLTIHHGGCTHYTRLILSGPLRGKLCFSSYPGLYPSEMGLFEWYEKWLDRSIDKIKITSWFNSLPFKKYQINLYKGHIIFMKGKIVNSDSTFIEIQIEGDQIADVFKKYFKQRNPVIKYRRKSYVGPPIEITEEGIWIDKNIAKDPFLGL